jgi:hypothetical protein
MVKYAVIVTAQERVTATEVIAYGVKVAVCYTMILVSVAVVTILQEINIKQYARKNVMI